MIFIGECDATSVGAVISKLRRSLFSVILFFVVLKPMDLFADWSYRTSGVVKPGSVATLAIKPPQTLYQVKVILTSGNKVVKRRYKVLKGNVTKEIKFTPPRGVSEWTASVVGEASKEELAVNFTFKIVSLGDLQADVLLDKSNFAEGKLLIKANRTLQDIELSAFDDQGQLDWKETLHPEQVQGLYELNFGQRDTLPRSLEVKIFDQYGFWVGVRVVRWYAEIPHEELGFDSGSNEVRQKEMEKVRDASKRVVSEMERFRNALKAKKVGVDLQLYVAGYTDTVGTNKENQKLSEARAKSIAKAFKSLGVSIPIFYAGFGERVLQVSTEDNVEESRNRRALYIVANHRPGGDRFPAAKWRRLR